MEVLKMKIKRLAAVLMTLVMPATMGWAQEKTGTGVDEPPQAATPTVTSGEVPTHDGIINRKPEEKGPRSWDEVIEYWMTPRPFPKESVIRIDEKYAYPHVAVGYKMEFVREEGDVVWLRGIPPEDPQSLYHRVWLQRQADEIDYKWRKEAYKEPGVVYFLDFKTEPVPPPFMDSLRFKRAGANLPDSGRWQMGFALADMNEDGHLDLVHPPQRMSIPPRPSIFLGDGTGEFEYWRAAKWPTAISLDYGGVAVADFDQDGHQDIAIAIHFKAQHVLYGDGNGNFTRTEKLQSPDPRVNARAVTAADFDGDGTTDLAFMAEVDFDRSTSATIEDAATVWILYRKGDSWKLWDKGLPTSIISDRIHAEDVDRDGRTDLVMASSTANWRRPVFFNRGPDDWWPGHKEGVLSSSYHFDVVPGGENEIFATFIQFRLIDNENLVRNGIIRYTVTQGEEEWVAGEPVVMDSDRSDVYFRLATGDLDGDGRLDFVTGRKGGGLEVYLQDANGGFVQERGDEFDGVGRIFDIRIVDIDGDGDNDIIAIAAPRGSERSGGVFVWLTETMVEE
jgi:hypothetical protein